MAWRKYIPPGNPLEFTKKIAYLNKKPPHF